jgi:hypothetical protein
VRLIYPGGVLRFELVSQMRILKYRGPATQYLIVLTNPAMQIWVRQRETIAISKSLFQSLKKAGHIGGGRLEDVSDEMKFRPAHIVRVSRRGTGCQ